MLTAAAVLCFVYFSGSVLALTDAETGKVYARFPVKNTGFSVVFKHSVNKSDVEEGYRVCGSEIYLEWCRYSAFGAGVADVLEPGQKLTYTDDGSMVISGYHRKIPQLVYRISTVYDHFLCINGKQYNLSLLGLKDKAIQFKIKRGIAL